MRYTCHCHLKSVASSRLHFLMLNLSIHKDDKATTTVRWRAFLFKRPAIRKRRFDKTIYENRFRTILLRSINGNFFLPPDDWHETIYIVLLVVLKPSRYRTPSLKRGYSFARTVERGESYRAMRRGCATRNAKFDNGIVFVTIICYERMHIYLHYISIILSCLAYICVMSQKLAILTFTPRNAKYTLAQRRGKTETCTVNARIELARFTMIRRGKAVKSIPRITR